MWPPPSLALWLARGLQQPPHRQHALLWSVSIPGVDRSNGSLCGGLMRDPDQDRPVLTRTPLSVFSGLVRLVSPRCLCCVIGSNPARLGSLLLCCGSVWSICPGWDRHDAGVKPVRTVQDEAVNGRTACQSARDRADEWMTEMEKLLSQVGACVCVRMPVCVCLTMCVCVGHFYCFNDSLIRT